MDPSSAPAVLPRIYRPSLAGRLAMAGSTVLMALLGAALVIAAATSERARFRAPIIAQMLIVVAALAAFTFRYLRVRIEARTDGVEVVNYLSTKRAAWDEIDRFEVGWAYWGATRVPRRGPPVTMNAAQKSNLYHWLKRRGRADVIVDELNAILGARRASSEPGPTLPPPPPPGSIA